MTTTDISTDKIEDKGLVPFDLSFSNFDTTPDRRSEPRIQRIFQLNCTRYDAEPDTFEISDAVVHNYGANGLYFEAANPVQPDDPICLSSKDESLENCDNEFAIGVHAKVVWCRRLNKSLDPSYGVGVNYFEPLESPVEIFN